MAVRSNAAPLTVADALALPVLRRAVPEVVAGTSNLNRPVRWVHVLDVDPSDLLRGGELVLSTGAGPGDDAAGQRRYVRALSEERAAGLVIELGMSYRQRLPPALVGEAIACELPLVALHRPVRFVDVTEAIHGALVEGQLTLLRFGQETAERLAGIVLERRGLSELLHEIARTVGNPVILENLAHQLVAYALHGSSDEEVLEAHGEPRLPVEGDERTGRGWASAAVRVRGRPWGNLIALDMDAPLEEQDRVALRHAATAVALELLHEESEEQLRARARGNFLVDLVQERLQESDASRRAAALEFPRSHGRLLPVALAWRTERWLELAEAPEHAWTALMSPLRNAIGAHRSVLMGVHSGRLLLVMSVSDEPVDETLRTLAADLRRPLERRGMQLEDVTVAFGQTEHEWVKVGRRLGRAEQAVAAARASPPTAWLDARRGSLIELLYAIRASPELLSFAREQLGVLFEERDQRERALLRTLEVYLDSGGRKAEAARVLHLERQSLYLRLERVERLLGIDLDDADTALGLHLAIRLLRLTQALGPGERLGH